MPEHGYVITSAGATGFRTDSRCTQSQWETALLCNDVSHWLGASLESDWTHRQSKSHVSFEVCDIQIVYATRRPLPSKLSKLERLIIGNGAMFKLTKSRQTQRFPSGWHECFAYKCALKKCIRMFKDCQTNLRKCIEYTGNDVTTKIS